MKEIYGKTYKRIGFIILNKVSNNNALGSNDLKEIIRLTQQFNADKNVDLIVIESGIKNIFTSGLDYDELKDFDEARAKVFSAVGQNLVKIIRNIKKTVLCKVDGKCFGVGFELALSSDVIFATEKSLFGFPEVNLGITPGLGGTVLFARKIYETFVKYLVFTGGDVNAKELFDKGIVNKICKHSDELDEEVYKFSELLSSRSVFALGLAKETINSGLETDLQNALLIEQNAFTVAFSSNDKKEGMTAFIEKRKPVFTDRWEDIEKL